MARRTAKVPPKPALPYLNRELSWLEFNQRVLDEALNPTVPLLERVKFYCITYSNLDEFFEVRVAGVKQQMESDAAVRSPDGLTPSETFRRVSQRVRKLVGQANDCWREQLLPALAAQGIRISRPEKFAPEDRLWLDAYYRAEVHPVLTPLAIDPSHPFPELLDKSLNLVTRLTFRKGSHSVKRLGVVQVPRVLPFLIEAPKRGGGGRDFVMLDDLIASKLGLLFPKTNLEGCWSFRVTRNSELYIDEEEVSNLLRAVENELHNRRKGDAVRLEVSGDSPLDIRSELLDTLDLDEDDLYVVDGPVHPTRLMALCDGDTAPELRDPPFVAPRPALPPEGKGDGIFAKIRERDLLLHHPYEGFDTVVDFLATAAADPRVLAIKQTLYRTGGDRRIVGALMDAVKNGKQVTAVVELKARFDEANNITWARRLEEAGVHVVYGVVGYKIHCKAALVVRRDDDAIRRYVHFGTGNYNPSTARVYTDLSYLTCRPEFGEDAAALFNLLTGVCQYQEMQRILVAPFELKDRLLELIRRETRLASEGLPGRIVAKMNALVDGEVVQALYEAAAAGVEIDLVVRGICCLQPGSTEGGSRIRVRSIVDRFLEHSRIWCFDNGHQPEVYIASADWMPRNFHGRIEVAIPILDGRLRERILTEIMETTLADNVKARHLQPDGSYRLAKPAAGAKPRRSQVDFIAIAQNHAPALGASKSRSKRPKLVLAPRPEALS